MAAGMDDDLLGLLLDRLDQKPPGSAVADLVLASLDDEDRLAEALGGSATPRAAPAAVADGDREPAGAYLRSITVCGFRYRLSGHPPPVAGSGPDGGGGLQRQRQVELRRGLRSAAQRRTPSLGIAARGVARGLAQLARGRDPRGAGRTAPREGP